MIETPTVLVLGAGASHAYGFPLGDALKDSILSQLRNANSCGTLVKCGFSYEKDVVPFREAFRHCYGAGTIDAFLRDRQEFIKFGRHMIAASLLPCENSKYMAPEENWYQDIFGILNENGFDAFGENKLSIVTFNYDRSLEHFLHESLKNGYNRTDEECAQQLKRIPIVHVHGQLGYLPWQIGGGNPYYAVKFGSSPTTPKDLNRAVKMIKIIHEANENNSPFFEATNLIKEAYCIYILGFGYHPDNLDRLGLRYLEGKKDLRGTAYNLSLRDQQIASEHMNSSRYTFNRNKDQVNNRLIDKTVYHFLRNHVIFS
jgi:hypothetical protein